MPWPKRSSSASPVHSERGTSSRTRLGLCGTKGRMSVFFLIPPVSRSHQSPWFLASIGSTLQQVQREAVVWYKIGLTGAAEGTVDEPQSSNIVFQRCTVTGDGWIWLRYTNKAGKKDAKKWCPNSCLVYIRGEQMISLQTPLQSSSDYRSVYFILYLHQHGDTIIVCFINLLWHFHLVMLGTLPSV